LPPSKTSERQKPGNEQKKPASQSSKPSERFMRLLIELGKASKPPGKKG
jgi:hypothetical protein